ncbi:MAG: SBBP repeat-containing protein, partial [Acidobacteriota bacterium]
MIRFLCTHLNYFNKALLLLLVMVVFASELPTISLNGNDIVPARLFPIVRAHTSLAADHQFGRLPLSFELNQGQVDSEVKFLSRSSSYTLFLTAAEAVFALKQAVVRMQLVAANRTANTVGIEPLSGKSNYIIGSDPKQWRVDVPHYAKVRYEQIYPGVDLVYYGNQQQLEYDFIVVAGADPSVIKLSFLGTNKITIDAQGDLILDAGNGQLRQHKPIVYQDVNGKRQTVASQYLLTENNLVGFRIGEYDTSQPLIIDPILSYSTYLGGSNDDIAYGMAVDDQGNVYLTGSTTSANFPTASPFQPACGGCPNANDTFITKINPAGNGLVFSTFLGGGGLDEGRAIKIDNNGFIYLAGSTRSGDFPVTASFGGLGDFDAFVAKLNPAGNGLVYSARLGGGATESGFGLAVDSTGNAWVAGRADSANFPTTPGALQREGSGDGFLSKLNSNGSALLYSTFIGGNKSARVFALAIDSDGDVYIGGDTNSPDFPVTAGAAYAVIGQSVGFVMKFSGDGTLQYSTLLGGTNGDQVLALA